MPPPTKPTLGQLCASLGLFPGCALLVCLLPLAAGSAQPVQLDDFSCLCTDGAKPVFDGATQFQSLGTCGSILAELAAPGEDACGAGGCANCVAFKAGAEADTVQSAAACCKAQGGSPGAGAVAVVCIGDSITEAPGHNTYPQQLQVLLGAHYTVTNVGESGATASAKGNLPYWSASGEQALAAKPDVAVVMLGTNDCDKGEGAEVRNSYLAGLDDIVQRLQALPTQPRVILATPPPHNASAYTDNACMANVVEVAIRATAAKYTLQVVDVRAVTTAAEYAQNYAEDGVHPNDAGLGAIARLVQAAVASPTLGLPTTTIKAPSPSPPPGGAVPVSVKNPGFEAADNASWGAGLTRGSSELFAPPQGSAYAAVTAGSRLSQALGTMEPGKVYTAKVWARSINAHVPDMSGERRGMQKTHANLLAKATLTLKAGGKDVAGATVAVSVNASNVVDAQGKAVANENDDGANVFMSGGYRMHAGNHLLYQDAASTDPLDPGDPWTRGVENERWGMAVGPASALNGSLVIKALGGGWTATDDYATSNGVKPTSRIEIVPLVGTAPNFAPPDQSGEDFMGPIYSTVLKHVGDEQPWVFDPHYCYDDATGKLWMTWGGHSGFVTEVDAATGLVVDPGTGKQPASTEFNTHASGVHTKILTNEPWTGEATMHASATEAPVGYEGDAFSTQAYMEGLGMLKHGDYFYACGTYGSMGDSYTIRCCRQATSHPNAPRGPYTDKEGETCSEFSQKQNRYPASMLLGPDGDHLVPGHPHFWQEADGGLYLGYDYRDQIPSVKEDAMAMRRLHFDSNGWPTVWIPIEVVVDTAARPELVGQVLTLELSASGAGGSKAAFDNVRVSTTTVTVNTTEGMGVLVKANGAAAIATASAPVVAVVATMLF